MFPFPYPLLSTEPTEDPAVLIRELAAHVWGRVRSFAARVAEGANALPQSDRESLLRMPF